MSNICPQKADLNQGLWQRLEADILNKYCTVENNKEHVWVLIGPIFSDNPEYITRRNGTRVAVPTSFYCILSRPFRYPEDTPSSSEYIAFIFSQDTPRNQVLNTSSVVSINEIEAQTHLNFFSGFTQHYQNTIENAEAPTVWRNVAP